MGRCYRVGMGGISFDFQYKMSFSIRMRGGTPTISISLFTSPFQFVFLELN